MVKSVVRLHTEERAQVWTLVTTERAAAAKLLHARSLLKAEVGTGGRHWSDAQMAEALDTSPATVHRRRQAWVEWSMEAAWARQCPTGRQYRTRDGAPEAQRIAVTCRARPAGRTRWPRKGLADKLGALDLVETSSAEWVRTTRKQIRSTRGSSHTG